MGNESTVGLLNVTGTQEGYTTLHVEFMLNLYG